MRDGNHLGMRGGDFERLALVVTFADDPVVVNDDRTDRDFALTERVDTMFDSSGAVIASVELMGRIDVRDGKVSLHRDYFDPTAH